MALNKEGQALVEENRASSYDCEKAIQDVLHKAAEYLKPEEVAEVRRAYELAYDAHKPQKRDTGEPYISHPIAVTEILTHLQIDYITLQAAILHDVVEDTIYTLEEITEMFGEEVAFLVDGVTKLNHFQYTTKEDQQTENYRKMFLAMAKDVRVVVIKLADRLHNMRTLKGVSEEKKRRKAKETMEIFAPLAHRLGIFNIKWELEDLSFRYLEPEAYYDLVHQMKEKRQTREAIVNDTMEQLQKALKDAGMNADVKGRPKHFYSIYKKMQKDHKDLSEIYDLYAVRVIVDSIPDCYAVLGIAHNIWKPLPYRFKDYIAMPKSNMYQSLHTTVIGTKGQPVEIQIRTWDMHRVSEYGVAAHWRYKEGEKAGDKDFDEKVGWIRQVLEWQDTSNPKEFINALKLDVFSAEVFVFTPKGDVMKLPKGSIPLDFAYRVHTDVGHRCIGAKVNGKMVPLDYTLSNGDIVEIITSKVCKPSLDWLNMVGSSESRNKIKNWFKKENKEENIVKGREALEKEARRLNMDWKVLNKAGRLNQVAQALHAGGETDLLSAIGFGGIPVNNVILRMIAFQRREEEEARQKEQENLILEKVYHKDKLLKKKGKSQSGVLVKGESGLAVRMAHCCNPVPGDPIVGYVTRGRGVSVHRSDCPNVYAMQDELSRMIDVEWENGNNESFPVAIELSAYDRNGVLMEVMACLSELKVQINSISAKTLPDKTVNIDALISVNDLSQLDYIMTKLRRIKNMYTVRRVKGGAKG